MRVFRPEQNVPLVSAAIKRWREGYLRMWQVLVTEGFQEICQLLRLRLRIGELAEEPDHCRNGWILHCRTLL